MSGLPFALDTTARPLCGVVVLQSDETIEDDFRRLFPRKCRFLVSRVPSGLNVSSETLAAMEAHLGEAAGLLPRGVDFDVLGYACTSGAAEIGSTNVARHLRSGAPAQAVTDPAAALIAACTVLGIRRLAIVSPYVPEVSDRLRVVLREAGIETPHLVSFEEAEEAKVARIAASSIEEAALEVARLGEIDGLFLSCTNLRTLDVIGKLTKTLGLPVLSSNLVLAWHMLHLVGFKMSPSDLAALRD